MDSDRISSIDKLKKQLKTYVIYEILPWYILIVILLMLNTTLMILFHHNVI